MDLRTRYLGLDLKSPIVASASPLWEKLENIQRAEDAGAGLIVLNSLFEEQIEHDQHELHHHTTFGTHSYAEALTYMPEADFYHVGPEQYLNHIRRAKERVQIPIIASLNGYTPGGWTDFARLIEEAGADALELNIYSIPTDMAMSAADVEAAYLDIVRSVRAAVKLPLAVKIGPFFSNMAHMAKQLAGAGADALVLFNRFYQPDIDLEMLEVKPNVLLSTPQALRLPLRWIAILYGRLNVDFAATSGIHTAQDVVKMLLVGASVTMMTSALLKHGISHIREVEIGVRQWLQEREYDSVAQLRGALSQLNSPDESGFERAQYTKAVSTLPAEYLRFLRR